MRQFALIGIVAASLASPAAAFDNKACATFLTGTWGTWEDDGQYNKPMFAMFTADGVYTYIGVGKKEFSTSKVTFKPGSKPQQCSVIPEGSKYGIDIWVDGDDAIVFGETELTRLQSQ